MGTLSLWTISPRPEYGPAAQKQHNKDKALLLRVCLKKSIMQKSHRVNKYDCVALKNMYSVKIKRKQVTF